MLIKETKPEKLWIICKKCNTPLRPKYGSCKCGNIRITGDASRIYDGMVEIEADDSDDVIYDNE